MRKNLKGMVLPSGKILERYEDTETGLITTVIPADAREEYGREVFRRGNEAGRRIAESLRDYFDRKENERKG